MRLTGRCRASAAPPAYQLPSQSQTAQGTTSALAATDCTPSWLQPRKVGIRGARCPRCAFKVISTLCKKPCLEWLPTDPLAAGTAIQQMWGVQWRSFAGEAAGAGSMDALADADLAPAQALLEACVLAPLLERVCLERDLALFKLSVLMDCQMLCLRHA